MNYCSYITGRRNSGVWCTNKPVEFNSKNAYFVKSSFQINNDKLVAITNNTVQIQPIEFMYGDRSRKTNLLPGQTEVLHDPFYAPGPHGYEKIKLILQDNDVEEMGWRLTVNVGSSLSITDIKRHGEYITIVEGDY